MRTLKYKMSIYQTIVKVKNLKDRESELEEIELENRPQRYPQRARRQRIIEGAIPWEAVDFVS